MRDKNTFKNKYTKAKQKAKQKQIPSPPLLPAVQGQLRTQGGGGTTVLPSELEQVSEHGLPTVPLMICPKYTILFQVR
jgi:hypothetical protein